MTKLLKFQPRAEDESIKKIEAGKGPNKIVCEQTLEGGKVDF